MVIAAWFFPAHAAELAHVTLVLSEPGGAYREVADGISGALKGAGIEVARVSNPQHLGEVKTGLFVTIGAQATQAVAALDLSTPVLSTLIPRMAVARIAGERRNNLSAVVLDQPLSRQLRLVRAALPQVKRVGAVLGPDSAPLAPALLAEAGKLGLKIVWRKIESQDELSPALSTILDEAEALLTLPDRLVSGRDTLHNLLLTSYRYQDPVIGYSAAYGKAGALLALFSTPAQIARQTAEIILALPDKSLPHVSAPKYFTVEVNSQVARSFGIAVPDPASLMESLKP